MPDPQPFDSSVLSAIDAGASKAELVWARVPLFGWSVADKMWARRARPVREDLIRQLESRPDTGAEWEEDIRPFALTICELAREQMGWPNANFLPADPFSVVFWSYEDGLDLESAMLEIESGFGIKTTEDDLQKWMTTDLEAFVQDIEARKSLIEAFA